MALMIAPGALIEVRDALWRVLKVDMTSTRRAAWTVIGVSAFVQDQRAVFLEDDEPSVRVLDPAERKLVEGPSPHLATIHRVKGLEFDRVVIAAVNDGVVPLASALASASDAAARGTAGTKPVLTWRSRVPGERCSCPLTENRALCSRQTNRPRSRRHHAE